MSAAPDPIFIALADDHAIVRESLIAYLNSVEGFEVLCHGANGKELLQAIETSSVKPDICILDVSMPIMNGYDTLVALKDLLPEVKVLVLTMIDHQGNFLRMMHAGADGYLLKEEEMEVLVHAIRFMAKHGFYSNSPSNIPKLISRTKTEDFIFSEKDQNFLRLCATELSYKQIASAMGVSEKTVEGYRCALFRRLGVKSRTGLAFYALQTGLVPFGYGSPPVE